ncbi:hypothetical protein BGZ94_007107 [Podila epigama]|nr:hypothetical protein BGZ94_007107 [Podila epigama]
MSRPTRSAATKAALAIKNDAMDNEIDNAKINPAQSNKSNAFATIMASAAFLSSTPVKRRAATTTSHVKKERRSTTTTTTTTATNSNAVSDNAQDNLSTQTALEPDLEDLVQDAAKVRRAGYHSMSYHHFTCQKMRTSIQKDLLAWYDIHYRKLPWRKSFHQGDHSEQLERDQPGQRAYEVWVSEIMCQQTQVATVIPYYNTWMSKWPTIAALAEADLEEVNKVWTGLGYYSRASRLHQGAQKVVKDFDSVLPRDPAVLEKEIPGVGRYTAAAIASHAYNVPAELVDGNVIRVLSRLRAIGGDVKSPKVIELHWQVAKELVHQDRPGCFNQALMELGATVCTPQNPKCGECPLQTRCRAYAEVVDMKRNITESMGISKKRTADENEQDAEDEICTICLPATDVDPKDQGRVTQYPRKAVKKAPRDEECAVAILERVTHPAGADGPVSEYLLVKRPAKGLLAGMWEFPTVEQDQLGRDHGRTQDNYTPSTYKERSSSSTRYLSDTLGMNWIKDCKSIHRTDLGSVQHLFSHIKKVYHAEWVLVKDDIPITQDSQDGTKVARKKGVTLPEVIWLSEQELSTAAIPTGINKTFQLLQKFKAQTGQRTNKVKEEDEALPTTKRKRTFANKGDASVEGKGMVHISKFFKPSS